MASNMANRNQPSGTLSRIKALCKSPSWASFTGLFGIDVSASEPLIQSAPEETPRQTAELPTDEFLDIPGKINQFNGVYPADDAMSTDLSKQLRQIFNSFSEGDDDIATQFDIDLVKGVNFQITSAAMSFDSSATREEHKKDKDLIVICKEALKVFSIESCNDLGAAKKMMMVLANFCTLAPYSAMDQYLKNFGYSLFGKGFGIIAVGAKRESEFACLPDGKVSLSFSCYFNEYNLIDNSESRENYHVEQAVIVQLKVIINPGSPKEWKFDDVSIEAQPMIGCEPS